MINTHHQSINHYVVVGLNRGLSWVKILGCRIILWHQLLEYLSCHLQGALDNMNLFQIITIMAFFMLLPVTILVEGLPILPQNLAAAVSAIQDGGCGTGNISIRTAETLYAPSLDVSVKRISASSWCIQPTILGYRQWNARSVSCSLTAGL